MVSYRATDRPVVTSRVGYGRTYKDALQDADLQLPDGTWKRIVVSNPHTIITDLSYNYTKPFVRSSLVKGEGEIIRVEKRILTVIECE